LYRSRSVGCISSSYPGDACAIGITVDQSLAHLQPKLPSRLEVKHESL
jgi:hypothetical protein